MEHGSMEPNPHPPITVVSPATPSLPPIPSKSGDQHSSPTSPTSQSFFNTSTSGPIDTPQSPTSQAPPPPPLATTSIAPSHNTSSHAQPPPPSSTSTTNPPTSPGKSCPTCHRPLSTTSLTPTLLPPFEHFPSPSPFHTTHPTTHGSAHTHGVPSPLSPARVRANSIVSQISRRGSLVTSATKSEWGVLRARLEKLERSGGGSGGGAGDVHDKEREREKKERKESGLGGVKDEKEAHGDGGGKGKGGIGTGTGTVGDAEMSKEELKDALIKVLNEVENLSFRHDTLLSTQLDLENALKIARSNLTMAEANSEMLEEALRRGGDGFAGRMAPLPKQSVAVTSASTPAPTSKGEEKKKSEVTSPKAAVGGNKVPAVTQTQTPKTTTNEEKKSEVAGPTSAVGGSKLPAVTQTQTPKTTTTTPVTTPATSHDRPVLTRRRSGSETTIKATPIPVRPGVERSNTVSANNVVSSGSASSPGSSLGSFFRRSMEKRPTGLNLSDIAKDFSASLPSPSAETRNQWLSQLGMALDGGSTPNLSTSSTKSPPTKSAAPVPIRDTGSSVPSRSSSPAPSPAPPSASQQYELYRLRQTLSSTQTQLSKLQLELSASQKAKTSLEEELESLSQELFEEANKMVAEERKKCVELETEVKDVKREMEAMKITMKVLEEDRVGRLPKVGIAGQGDATEILAEQQTSGEAGGGGEEGEVKRGTTPSPVATVPAETNLEELMKRMEADFGKL